MRMIMQIGQPLKKYLTQHCREKVFVDVAKFPGSGPKVHPCLRSKHQNQVEK